MNDVQTAEPRTSVPVCPGGRLLLIEPFSGISGDMFLGALLDLGVSLERVEDGLRCLPVRGYRLAAHMTDRAGIRATKFDVVLGEEAPSTPDDPHDSGGQAHERGHDHADESHGHSHGDPKPGPEGHGHSHHAHRRYGDIRRMIETCDLPRRVKGRSLDAFRLLAEAEGRVHGRKPDDVEFHEVGAVDSIVDIVGAMIALEELAPARVCSTAVNVGRGTVKCQHGIYPVPAPATESLLRGIPTFSNEVEGELTTPTGAALLASIVHSFGARPAFSVEATGYGAGRRNPRGSANVLRVSLGCDAVRTREDLPEDEVVVLESAIDDMNPEVFGYLQELLLSAGALDFFLVPAQMKKNRPGTLLTVLCAPSDADRIASCVLIETSTLGVRQTRTRRLVLPRDSATVGTAYGPVRVKRALLPGGKVRCSPEYEDCRRLAREKGVPLLDVYSAASIAAVHSGGGDPTSP